MKSSVIGSLIVLSAACAQAAEGPQRVCTLAGCENGVSVLLGSAYATPVTVEIGPVDGPMQRGTCDDTIECTTGLFFPDLSAPELRVRVMSATDTITRTVRPDYRIVQPNGPDCPPTCRQAQVRLGDAAPVEDPPLPSEELTGTVLDTTTPEARLQAPPGDGRAR